MVVRVSGVRQSVGHRPRQVACRQFFEAAGFPDDEDDAAQVAAIRADAGVFASAIVRRCCVYHAGVWRVRQGPAGNSSTGWTGSAALWAWTRAGRGRRPRSAFFSPPDDFVRVKPRVFLTLSGGGSGGGGRVVVELDGESAPKCAYNFKCLCTGERGTGEVTGCPSRSRVQISPPRRRHVPAGR